MGARMNDASGVHAQATRHPRWLYQPGGEGSAMLTLHISGEDDDVNAPESGIEGSDRLLATIHP